MRRAFILHAALLCLVAGPARAEHIATAQWLQGEALLRLNRLDEANPVIKEGLAAVAGAPNTKLHGDLVMAQAGVLATQGRVQEALNDFGGWEMRKEATKQFLDDKTFKPGLGAFDKSKVRGD